MIAEAVRAYIRFYLNFRSQRSLVQLGPWSLEKDVIQDGGLDVSFGLSFNASSKLSPAAVINIANQELNSLLAEEQAEDLSAVVSSFLHSFYLPAQGFASMNNFIHYKAIALFQLSLNVPHEPLNAKVRLLISAYCWTRLSFMIGSRHLSFRKDSFTMLVNPWRLALIC